MSLAAAPFQQLPSPRVAIPEIVIGSLLALLGFRSLVKWLRTEFVAESWREQVLFALHVSARVGLWFGFAGFFFGLALVDDPGRFGWYLLVPIGLAGVQLVTAVVLGQGMSSGTGGNG
jgi:hypothetical protein